MKTKYVFIALALLTLLNSQFTTAHAQGTTFTYQGRLGDNGQPANGSYEMVFYLYDNLTSGGQLANLGIVNVPVTNGMFTVPLNFGGGMFPGADRWLEITVKTNGAATFTTLSPRQKLTPTPYAITASNLSGQLSGAQITDGTVTSAKVDSTQLQLRISGTAPAGQFITGIAANGSVTASADATDWKLTGNNVAPGQFLGSTNNQPLELRVNGTRGLRLEANGGFVNLIGGAGNTAGAGTIGSVVAGGVSNTVSALKSVVGGGSDNLAFAGSYQVLAGGQSNQVVGAWTTLAGGSHNQAGGFYSSIGGGQDNVVNEQWNVIGGGNANIATNAFSMTIAGGSQSILASSHYGTIGGGWFNRIITSATGSVIGGGELNLISGAADATISGGYGNSAYGNGAAVGGGSNNLAFGSFSAIPGGLQNDATGNYSFAAGRQAKANHTGTFVMADSTAADFVSTAPNQFLIRASGGVGINMNNPTAALHVGGIPGVDGIRFPNGTLQTTAPVPVFVSGAGLNPTTTNQFLAAPVTVTVNSTNQRILVTSHKALGSTIAGGATGLNLFIGFRSAGTTVSPTPVGDGIFGNQVSQNTRVTMGLSAVVTGLSPGNYEVGLMGLYTGAANWNNNEYSYTTATVY